MEDLIIKLVDSSVSAAIALILVFRVDRHLQQMTRTMRHELDEIRKAMNEISEAAKKRARARTNTPREVPITRGDQS